MNTTGDDASLVVVEDGGGAVELIVVEHDVLVFAMLRTVEVVTLGQAMSGLISAELPTVGSLVLSKLCGRKLNCNDFID